METFIHAFSQAFSVSGLIGGVVAGIFWQFARYCDRLKKMQKGGVAVPPSDDEGKPESGERSNR